MEPNPRTTNTIANPKLLICADWFDPGVRAGGPIRSCVNLARLLRQTTDISIITSSYDLGASKPYPEITEDSWVNWDTSTKVRYCKSTFRRLVAVSRFIRNNQGVVVYLNSMFSFAGTLWPLLFTKLTRSKSRIVLAPRGMLKATALSQKRWKKQPLIWAVRKLGLVTHVHFHATSEDEVTEINDAFGKVSVTLIPNVPQMPVAMSQREPKRTGFAQLCLLGRVHPIKNILWLLNAMKYLDASCELKIIGPIEDEAYYEKCSKSIEELPNTCSVQFLGPRTATEVNAILANADAMILPTLGENFGHAIFEAFSVGTPVIISDRTIWRNLDAQKAGWDIELSRPEAFLSAIAEVAGMNAAQHQELRRGAVKIATDFIQMHSFLSDYQSMFFATD